MNREFLMLAKEHTDQDLAGWFVSEKLDGQRALWDGGITAGLPCTQVPWANTAKDARLLVEQRSTGLWSRYGKVIHAPDWWTALLPKGVLLDVELWLGRHGFQDLRSIVGSHTPGLGWKQVMAHILDVPTHSQVFQDGKINNANFKHMMSSDQNKGPFGSHWLHGSETFEDVVNRWQGKSGDVWQFHHQYRVKSTGEARDLEAHFVARGGEGAVARKPIALWEPRRVGWVLKMKPEHDMEGEVVGFTWGRKTDKESKHLGRMGALILRLPSGQRLELSGFTDEERAVQGDGPRADNGLPLESIPLEGRDATTTWSPAHFALGTHVTFTYRELSNDGIPKEARYKRVRSGE